MQVFVVLLVFLSAVSGIRRVQISSSYDNMDLTSSWPSLDEEESVDRLVELAGIDELNAEEHAMLLELSMDLGLKMSTLVEDADEDPECDVLDAAERELHASTVPS